MYYTNRKTTRYLIRIASALIVALMLLAFLPQAAFAATIENPTALTVSFYKTTASGFEPLDTETQHIVRLYHDGEQELYCAEDIAALTGDADTAIWQTGTESLYDAVSCRRRDYPCIRVTMKDGAQYEIVRNTIMNTTNGMWQPVATAGSDIHMVNVNDCFYMTATVLETLFPNCYIGSETVHILSDAEEEIKQVSTLTSHKGKVTNALFLLYIKDRTEGYDFVLKHCKKMKTEHSGLRAGGTAYVMWNSRNIMHLVDNATVNCSIPELAVRLVHEATHCNPSTATNETEAVVNEIRCRIQIGQEVSSVLDRIDELNNTSGYKNGAKLAMEKYGALLTPTVSAQ